MGGVESKMLKECVLDEKHCRFESVEPQYKTWFSSSYKFITWDSTPSPLRHELKYYVRRCLNRHDLKQDTEVIVWGYYGILRKHTLSREGIYVNLKWVILEALMEMKIQRKFTLHYNQLKNQWVISFVYEFGDKKDLSTNSSKK